MKKYEDFNFIEKEQAVKIALYDLIDGIAIGALEINFIDKANQDRLKQILEISGGAPMQTRYRTLAILNAKPIRAELEKLALATAEGTSYNDDGTPKKTVLEVV